jgi:mannan endo-1,4-beta-mannosidase
MKALRIILFAFLPVLAAVAVYVIHSRQPHVKANADSNANATAPGKCHVPNPKKHYVGVVIYRPWEVTLPEFEQQSGTTPTIISYYINFGTPVNIDHVSDIYGQAFPIIQIDPYHASLEKIADGHFDSYLIQQAHAVASFRCPVAISFGHEMNGDWYPWGDTHVTPAIFIKAWQHIYHIFTTSGAKNVKWVWTVNRDSSYVSSLTKWWPGNKYVNWVGIDGYYRKPGNNFTYVFRHTIQQIRSLTKDPILITETSVTRVGPQAANITNLFQGAGKDKVFAVVWFNVKAKEDWSLAGRGSSVLAAFKAAANAYVGP